MKYLTLSGLAGYRTYLCGIGLIFAAGLHALGYINDLTYMITKDVLTGGGLLALRAAVTKAIVK